MEIDRTAQATRTAPSNAAVFCVPSSTAWFVFGGGIVFLAFSFLGLALAFSKSSDRLSLGLGLAAAAGFGIFAVVAFRSFVRLRGKIAINEDGIWYLPHRGNGTSIQWKDISAVKADDTGQRLVLSDDLQRKTIRIEYQLKSFREIRDFVIAHTTAQIQRYASNLTVFHRTWINKIILAILGGPFLVVSWLSYRQGLVGLPFFVPLCLGNAVHYFDCDGSPSSVNRQRRGNSGVSRLEPDCFVRFNRQNYYSRCAEPREYLGGRGD